MRAGKACATIAMVTSCSACSEVASQIAVGPASALTAVDGCLPVRRRSLGREEVARINASDRGISTAPATSPCSPTNTTRHSSEGAPVGADRAEKPNVLLDADANDHHDDGVQAELFGEITYAGVAQLFAYLRVSLGPWCWRNT
jgi:hypothetical protein